MNLTRSDFSVGAPNSLPIVEKKTRIHIYAGNGIYSTHFTVTFISYTLMTCNLLSVNKSLSSLLLPHPIDFIGTNLARQGYNSQKDFPFYSLAMVTSDLRASLVYSLSMSAMLPSVRKSFHKQILLTWSCLSGVETSDFLYR